MTMYFIKKSVFRKRLVIFVGLCLAYVVALFSLGAYTRLFENYKLYYIKSYAYALNYTIGNALTYAFSPIGNLFHTDVANGDTASTTTAQSIPVLLYHGILNTTDGKNVTVDEFKDQMFALKDAGYHTITIDDFYAFLAGQKQLPAKSFLLTFDDGRKDSYYPADPILHALGFNAVMFTIANFASLDKSSYYLTKDEITAMANSPRWQIESHTRTHRNLVQIPQSELPDEIVGSKQILENLTGKPITAFAFPFGETGQEPSDFSGSSGQVEQQIVGMAKSTYKMSFYQFFTVRRFTQNYADPAGVASNYLVKRIEPQPTWTSDDLLTVLKNGTAKDLPFTGTQSLSDGWVNTLWGSMNFSNGDLLMHSLDTTTGSAVVLDGTRAWKDYQFDVHVNSRIGTNMYVWARYQDDDNYLACNFGNGLVHIEQTLGGKTDVLKGSQVVALPTKDFTASIRVNGRSVSCSVDGTTIVTTTYSDPFLDTGGVGLKVWDPVAGQSGLDVSNISVTPISQSNNT